MIKCGECVRHDNCWLYDEHKNDNGTCVWADVQSDMTESPNDVIESQNDVIKKPRTVRYKLHKPIEYVSIEFDEEETVTDIAHYEVVYCKDCKHLEVTNTQNTYAICLKHDIIFEPFEDSTNSNFCSWGERREP